ncbi:hypothetical protein ACE1ET_02540 [Saccharicrinis sp. FJH62]|uniref:hypothetical protein n=1 Tax=Saccharicrinis sp. FJH62 TaxID=3344657 RepID=UPI0035D4A2BD
MRRIIILLIVIATAFTSCLKESDNYTTVYFNESPGAVYDFPKGDSSQYLIHSLNYNVFLKPDVFPDSLKVNGMQILFTGTTYDESVQFTYTDTASDELKTALIKVVHLQTAKRAQQDMKVTYGTSFGECIGYCSETMTLSRGQLDFLYESLNTDTLPDIDCSMNFPVDSTNMVLDFVSKPLFYYMESVYGCPDCNDGGEEWVSIEDEYYYKKIRFEYMNEPEELTKLVTILRRFASYSECKPTL